MGCGGSKLDHLRPVALCRDRSHFLADAIRHRYALAEAHCAYVSSLRSVGPSLQRFFDEGCLETSNSSSSSSPALALPPHSRSKGKGEEDAFSSACGSHLPLCESSEEEEEEDEGDGDYSESEDDFGYLFPSADNGRRGGGEYQYGFSTPFDVVNGAATSNGSFYFHYARKGPPVSVVGIERGRTAPFESEDVATVQVGTFAADYHSAAAQASSSSSSFRNLYDGYYYYNDGNGYLQSNQPRQGGGSYSRASEGYGHAFGGFGDPSSSSSSFFGGMGNGFSSAGPSSSAYNRPTPPPPSPPTTSTWDFLNPFGTFDNFYKCYSNNSNKTPSRSSREVREEEGIPELEEDEHEEEVVKEAYVGRHSCGTSAAAGPSSSSSSSSKIQGETTRWHSKGAPAKDDNSRSNGQWVRNRGRSGNDRENSPIIDKNVVSNKICQGHSSEKGGASFNLVAGGSMTVPVVLEEIKSQFDKASTSCEEISGLLEVGKLPYHQRRYEVVSSRMIHAIAPSLLASTISVPSGSKGGEGSSKDLPASLEIGEENCMGSGNLSAIFEKLYIWEKKLHEEVRAEEKLRVLHDKKCKQLKHLDDIGAEAQKVESTRAVIKKLSTKIRIAIQVIESISNRISKLRDEELWPQLKKLIQGLFKMWQAVVSCHGNQFRAIIEAQALDAGPSASAGKLNDAHMEATMQLAMELLKWIETFSCWIDATKNYVKALNSWLQKCLNYDPEVTADGIAPFSPGKLGAPSIFVVCNSWSRAMDRISEREVVKAMQDFTAGILHVWQLHYTERRMRSLTDKDMDRMLKALDIEDQKVHKAVDAVKKRCSQLPSQNHVPFTRDIVRLNHTGEPRNLHSGLIQMFEEMEKFASSSMEAYLEL